MLFKRVFMPMLLVGHYAGTELRGVCPSANNSPVRIINSLRCHDAWGLNRSYGTTASSPDGTQEFQLFRATATAPCV
jgi:hypothetical protein